MIPISSSTLSLLCIAKEQESNIYGPQIGLSPLNNSNKIVHLPLCADVALGSTGIWIAACIFCAGTNQFQHKIGTKWKGEWSKADILQQQLYIRTVLDWKKRWSEKENENITFEAYFDCMKKQVQRK